MADTGSTNWPLNTDDLNIPSDATTRAPTSAGDGHYTFLQWLERTTGMLRAIATDLITGMTHNLPMGGFKITGLGTPSASTDAATKAYVDATAQGLSVKPSVKGASTTNHSISAFSGMTIDGGSVSLSVGDRILLKDQSTGSENGLWVFQGAGSALTRPTDFAHGAQEAGAFVFVESGTANAGAGYVLASTSIVVDTTAQTWTQFSGAGEITAGAGLTKTGNTINAVANADATIVVNADDLKVGTLIAGNFPTGGSAVIISTMIVDGTITDTDVAAANKDGATGTASLRTLGTGTTQAAAGTHSDANHSDAGVITANNQTASYTLVAGDVGKVIECNNASAMSLTVPTNASVPFAVGTLIEVWQQGAGQVTVTAAGGVTFRAPNGAKTATQYSTVALRKQATDTWVVSGDTAP